MKKLILIIAGCALLISCSPKIGSEKWCKDLEEKPKADWTPREVKDYAKHCIFKQ